MLGRFFKKLFSRETETPEHFGMCGMDSRPATNNNKTLQKIVLLGLGNSVVKKRFKIALPSCIAPDDMKDAKSIGSPSISPDDLNDEKIVGLDFYTHHYNDIKFQIWNCSTEERFRNIIKAYFHGANSILIFIDNIEDFTTLNNTITDVLQFNDTPSVFIVFDLTANNANVIFDKAKVLKLTPLPIPLSAINKDLFLKIICNPESEAEAIARKNKYGELCRNVDAILPEEIMIKPLRNITCSYLSESVSTRFFPLSPEFFPEASKERFEPLLVKEAKEVTVLSPALSKK
jgi:signal recognition particle receptor subunit beta